MARQRRQNVGLALLNLAAGFASPSPNGYPIGPGIRLSQGLAAGLGSYQDSQQRQQQAEQQRLANAARTQSLQAGQQGLQLGQNQLASQQYLLKTFGTTDPTAIKLQQNKAALANYAMIAKFNAAHATDPKMREVWSQRAQLASIGDPSLTVEQISKMGQNDLEAQLAAGRLANLPLEGRAAKARIDESVARADAARAAAHDDAVMPPEESPFASLTKDPAIGKEAAQLDQMVQKGQLTRKEALAQFRSLTALATRGARTPSASKTKEAKGATPLQILGALNRIYPGYTVDSVSPDGDTLHIVYSKPAWLGKPAPKNVRVSDLLRIGTGTTAPAAATPAPTATPTVDDMVKRYGG